jgi:CarD family transcriptional regulator
MFALGDKIVYGSEGVYTVAEYTRSPFDNKDQRVFYLLRPLHGSASNVIVTPSEGGSTVMREIMTRDEALALIERVPEVSEVVVEKERLRRDIYREVLKTATADNFVSLIKTVRARREVFLAQKRRLSEADTDFEGRAKHCLFGELSVALDVTVGEAERLIVEKMG